MSKFGDKIEKSKTPLLALTAIALSSCNMPKDHRIDDINAIHHSSKGAATQNYIPIVIELEGEKPLVVDNSYFSISSEVAKKLTTKGYTYITLEAVKRDDMLPVSNINDYSYQLQTEMWLVTGNGRAYSTTANPNSNGYSTFKMQPFKILLPNRAETTPGVPSSRHYKKILSYDTDKATLNDSLKAAVASLDNFTKEEPVSRPDSSSLTGLAKQYPVPAAILAGLATLLAIERISAGKKAAGGRYFVSNAARNRIVGTAVGYAATTYVGYKLAPHEGIVFDIGLSLVSLFFGVLVGEMFKLGGEANDRKRAHECYEKEKGGSPRMSNSKPSSGSTTPFVLSSQDLDILLPGDYSKGAAKPSTGSDYATGLRMQADYIRKNLEETGLPPKKVMPGGDLEAAKLMAEEAARRARSNHPDRNSEWS